MSTRSTALHSSSLSTHLSRIETSGKELPVDFSSIADAQALLFDRPLADFFAERQTSRDKALVFVKSIDQFEFEVMKESRTPLARHIERIDEQYFQLNALPSVASAVQQWKLAGEAFLQLRKERRGQELRSSDVSSLQSNEISFTELIELVRQRIQSEQIVDEHIFTVAFSQSLVNEVLRLYQGHHQSLNLFPFDPTEIFPAAHDVYKLQFATSQIVSIVIYIW